MKKNKKYTAHAKTANPSLYLQNRPSLKKTFKVSVMGSPRSNVHSHRVARTWSNRRIRSGLPTADRRQCTKLSTQMYYSNMTTNNNIIIVTNSYKYDRYTTHTHTGTTWIIVGNNMYIVHTGTHTTAPRGEPPTIWFQYMIMHSYNNITAATGCRVYCVYILYTHTHIYIPAYAYTYTYIQRAVQI